MTQEFGLVRDRRGQKCKSPAIMAAAHTQHERMSGYPDDWECKVNKHTWCVACFFTPDIELFFMCMIVGISLFWFYVIS